MRALTAYTDDLFAPAMHQLVDDAQGGIRYWPDVIDPATAQRWFDLLHTRAAWTHLQRPMYDRIVDVPRLLANYAVDALPDDLPLAQLLACVQARAPAPYTRIGMNLYRDGHDSVAMHGDKLHTVAAGHPITLVSLPITNLLLQDATHGRTPRLRDSFVLARRVLGQAGVFALGQGVIILLWSRAGMMVGAFFPFDGGDPGAFREFLALGSAVGAVFATLTFAVAAFSLPMIADRDVDMVTAAVSSVHAVMRNKRVMLVWGLLLVVLTAIGFATALLGLGLLMPWLAYASWHGYRETLDAAAWPALE